MQIVDKLSHTILTSIVGMIIFVSLTPFNVFSVNPVVPDLNVTDTLKSVQVEFTELFVDSTLVAQNVIVDDKFQSTLLKDSSTVVSKEADLLFDKGVVSDTLQANAKKVFTPDPTRAVWMSALCPGLGQIYNRRYWKLPIVIGGFMGLGYGASWNNSMLTDYTRAYYDLMDNDPSTKSYMDFFPPTTKEESLNRDWLERTLKSRKDYFRRNRDLCVIGMIGVYLIAVVDAYVDASLTNFDINPDLSMQVVPALLQDDLGPYPAVGLMMAINF